MSHLLYQENILWKHVFCCNLPSCKISFVFSRDLYYTFYLVLWVEQWFLSKVDLLKEPHVVLGIRMTPLWACACPKRQLKWPTQLECHTQMDYHETQYISRWRGFSSISHIWYIDGRWLVNWNVLSCQSQYNLYCVGGTLNPIQFNYQQNV